MDASARELAWLRSIEAPALRSAPAEGAPTRDTRLCVAAAYESIDRSRQLLMETRRLLAPRPNLPERGCRS